MDGDGGKEEEDVDMDMADLETLNYDDLDSVSKLQKSQRYADIMQVSPHFPFFLARRLQSNSTLS